MLAVRDNIDDHIRNESLSVAVHSAVEFTSERMLLACDNNEDRTSNE
jgi:hypothetical protein